MNYKNKQVLIECLGILGSVSCGLLFYFSMMWIAQFPHDSANWRGIVVLSFLMGCIPYGFFRISRFFK